MPETERDLSILKHIVSYCEDIESAVSRFGDGIEAFSGDKDYRNACAMCILQIGELANHLSQGVSGTSHTGAIHYYYSCKNHRKHACKLKNQRKELIEAIVLYLLGDLLRDPALRIMIADECYAYHMRQNDDGGAYEASLRARLKEVEGKLANLLKALEAGIFNDTTAERMKVRHSGPR